MISASSLDRTATCPASQLLAQEDYVSEYAEAGLENHDKRDGAIKDGDIEALPEQVQRFFVGGVVSSEVAMAYNLRTDAARLLKVDGHRRYEVTAEEIPGTADVVIVQPGHVTVVDWKLWKDNGSERQLKFYALCAARIHGATSATVVVSYETGFVKVVELDEWDLDAFAVELRNIVARATDPTAPTKVSQHCKFCPAFNACPEQRALAAQSAGEALWLRVEATNLADDDVAADFYALHQRVKTLSKRMGDKLYARASERAIPLGNGLVFGARPTKGNDELDADKAYAIARDTYGQPFADDMVTRDATKAGIKRAAKKHGLVAAKVERDIVAKLEAVGGVTNEPGQKIEEHHPARPGESEAA